MKVLWVTILSVGCLLCKAQEKQQTYPVITLRANPLAFAEQDAGIMLGLGVQWNRHWSASVDPMYIFYAPFGGDVLDDGPFNKDQVKVKGFKVRADLKYFIHGYDYGKRGWFVGAEFHYKRVAGTHWADFGVNETGGQFDYYQHATYDQVRREIGGAVKIGMMRRLWSPRWAFEFYCGAGLKFRNLTTTNQPAGGSFLQSPNQNSFFASDTDAMPILPGGIKFVYRIF